MNIHHPVYVCAVDDDDDDDKGRRIEKQDLMFSRMEVSSYLRCKGILLVHHDETGQEEAHDKECTVACVYVCKRQLSMCCMLRIDGLASYTYR